MDRGGGNEREGDMLLSTEVAERVPVGKQDSCMIQRLKVSLQLLFLHHGLPTPGGDSCWEQRCNHPSIQITDTTPPLYRILILPLIVGYFEGRLLQGTVGQVAHFTQAECLFISSIPGRLPVDEDVHPGCIYTCS